jgi:type II secretory pathway pseudopilin PulG
VGNPNHQPDPWRKPTATRRRRARPAAILLEATLAIAIFVMAAAAILSALGQATTTFTRAREQELLADLARSALSQIESGAARAETLDGPVAAWPALLSAESQAAGNSPASGRSRYELKIQTAPTETTGVIMVTVEALKLDDRNEKSDSFVLHQAVVLRSP